MSEAGDRPLAELRLLVADDNEDVRRVVRWTLEREGASVVEVTHGGEVLETLQQDGAFDGIIMDVEMPEVGGLTATRKLRERGFDSVIVLISGSRTLDVEEQAHAAGAQAFVEKPFQLRRFTETVRALVRGETGQ